MLAKHLFNSVSLVAAAITAFAAPLDKSKISADAKWLLHLDVDAFRKTTVGEHVIGQILQPQLDAHEEFKKLNLSLNVQNISSITAYGSAFEKNGQGVLMLTTTADVKKDLDTLAGMSSVAGADKKGLILLQQQPYLLYCFNKDVFIAPKVADTVLIAKSQEQIDNARDVLMGKAKTLAQNSEFGGYPETPNGFFVGMADGFNDAEHHMPPQAQVLKEARGGRVALGETDRSLFVNLVFRGKDEEGSAKIQQVLQGLVALVSLSQQDKDITDLANATKVSLQGRNVIVDVHCPSNELIEKIEAKHKNKNIAQNGDDSETQKKPKKKKKKAKVSDDAADKAPVENNAK